MLQFLSAITTSLSEGLKPDTARMMSSVDQHWASETLCTYDSSDLLQLQEEI